MSPNSLISIFILVAGLAQCQVQKMRFCATRSEFSLCLKMEEEVDLVQCISRPDRLSCMEALEADEADTLNLDAANLFVAGNHFNLSILAYEQNNGEPYKYRSVALVPKSLELSSLNDLKGKKSCHTGVGRTAGWQIPITYLQRSGIMSQDCRGELETVENFFNQSCAPGKWSKDPIVDAELKRKHPRLCSLCGDPEKCSKSDIYMGYEGALGCLNDGKGDVAFSKTEAVEKYLQVNPNFDDEQEYLCPDNTRRNLRDGADLSCTWGVRPSNGFVVSSHKTEEEKEEIYSTLRQIFSRYSSNIPQIQRQEKPEWFKKLFVSSVNVTDILRASSLHQSPLIYLGDFRYTMDRSLGECQPSTVRFCTTSEQGINKCNDLGKVVISRRMDITVGCILESTTANCITAVKEGRADLITLDGGDVYRAGKYSDLVPIASELYGEVDATYFAVAVIPADSQISQPEDLRGKRSCHTGIGRTAGWVMPVGFFINSTLIPKNQCDRTAAVADLFSASCAPGANDPKYNPTGSGAVKLCQQCVGDENGEHKCARSSVERYSGYAGAFRCLSENDGDVSFVKHTTVSEYTNGKSDLDWAKDLKSTDYKLLCKNGGTDNIENYENCNLGKVPSHQVMISGSSSIDRRLELATKVADINKWFGLLSPNFDIFKSYGNKADLLFKDSTTELKALPLHATYKDALGDDYLNAVEAADPLLCTQEA